MQVLWEEELFCRLLIQFPEWSWWPFLIEQPKDAKRAYREAGIEDFEVVNNQADLEHRIAKGKYSVVEDPFLLCKAENIDVIIEVTGAVEFSSRIVFEAIKNKKHVVIMDAELDGTVGAILKVYADKAGVVITNADGDQPGVEMNLFRFVKSIGVKPVLCGNIKGLQDPYRNPTTQEGFAKKWGQNPGDGNIVCRWNKNFF